MRPIMPELRCEALGPCHVVRGQGHEAVSALPHWTLEVLLAEPALDVRRVLRAPATLLLGDEAGSVRPIGLIVTAIACEGGERDGHRFSVELAPREWLLSRRAGYRVFVDRTTQEIVPAVVGDAGMPASSVVWRLGGTYMQRLQCTQYAETEWAFVERILAEEGISYWFDWDDDHGAVVVLGDAPGSHNGLLGSQHLRFDDASGFAGTSDALSELALVHEVCPDATHVRDFDIRQPDVFIEGRAGEGALEVFEFPACVLTSAAAERRARVRLEQLQRLDVHATAVSGNVRLQPGRTFHLDGCADEAMNGEYLVVAVEHELTAGSPNDANGVSYRNRVTLVPAKAKAFRPAVPDTHTRVPGVETAVTTGPHGEEIHVDDLGRVKLRFPWDRAGITDDRSSAWARCIQMNMDGAMLLPRVGWEVPVTYIDGNPDRPFVLGRVYNATAVAPYALPAGAATTTLQSATSPGGGSTNEIRMSDIAGKQEMFVHASKDQTVSVGGSSRTTVSGNETHSVDLAYTLSVLGAQSLSVGASQSVNVGTNYAIGIKGGRSEAIGGAEIVAVTANRAVVAGGAYAEIVGGFYGLQCNQSNTTVQGAFVQSVGGAMVLASGLGTSESVAAVRTEVVGGVRNIVAADAYTEPVRGPKSVIAGATSESSSGPHVTKALASGTVKVGGSAKLTAGGDVVIEAPVITIQAGGSLLAGAFELAGGALKAKTGTTDVKGTIKRQGGAKVAR
ncbi:Putative vgr related protein [Minicystis rosea]|nr:Putative vgr related protein [Minicystis rosea]